MKKYDLLKVLGISLLITFFLSWFIPAGTFSSGSFVSSEATNPLGLYDLFKIPVYVINRFVQYVLLFLAIGGFYGVLNKSGVYSKIVEDVVGKYKTKRIARIINDDIIFSGRFNVNKRFSDAAQKIFGYRIITNKSALL